MQTHQKRNHAKQQKRARWTKKFNRALISIAKQHPMLPHDQRVEYARNLAGEWMRDDEGVSLAQSPKVSPGMIRRRNHRVCELLEQNPMMTRIAALKQASREIFG